MSLTHDCLVEFHTNTPIASYLPIVPTKICCAIESETWLTTATSISSSGISDQLNEQQSWKNIEQLEKDFWLLHAWFITRKTRYSQIESSQTTKIFVFFTEQKLIIAQFDLSSKKFKIKNKNTYTVNLDKDYLWVYIWLVWQLMNMCVWY